VRLLGSALWHLAVKFSRAAQERVFWLSRRPGAWLVSRIPINKLSSPAFQPLPFSDCLWAPFTFLALLPSTGECVNAAFLFPSACWRPINIYLVVAWMALGVSKAVALRCLGLWGRWGWGSPGWDPLRAQSQPRWNGGKQEIIQLGAEELGFNGLAKIASFRGSRINAVLAANEGSLKSSHGCTLCCDGNQQKMSRPWCWPCWYWRLHRRSPPRWPYVLGSSRVGSSLIPRAFEWPKQRGVALRLGSLEPPWCFRRCLQVYPLSLLLWKPPARWEDQESGGSAGSFFLGQAAVASCVWGCEGDTTYPAQLRAAVSHPTCG